MPTRVGPLRTIHAEAAEFPPSSPYNLSITVQIAESVHAQVH